MNDRVVGLSTACFYQMSIFSCLPTIREVGISTIEVCSSVSHLDYLNPSEATRAAYEIQKLDLRPYSFHAPFSDDIDISALEPEIRAESLKKMLIAVEAASAIGAENFVIHPGPEKDRVSVEQEHRARLNYSAETLRKICKRCEEEGISLLLENQLPHLLFGNTEDLLWLREYIDSPTVGICFDTGHSFLGGSMEADLEQLSQHMTMLHVHDNNRVRDDHLPPGEGKIDWRRLLVALESYQFHGALICEFAGSDLSTARKAASRGRRYILNLLEELSIQSGRLHSLERS